MENYIFIVLKMLHYNDQGTDIVSEQVSLILGNNFVFSFQEGLKGDVFEPLRQRIRGSKGKIRKMGADYLAYSMLDGIVDNYFTVLEKLGSRSSCLKKKLLPTPNLKHCKKYTTSKGRCSISDAASGPCAKSLPRSRRGNQT